MALVLGRRINESIIIVDENNREIEVTVIKSENDSLRLKVEAPREFQIFRSEIYSHKDVTVKT